MSSYLKDKDNSLTILLYHGITNQVSTGIENYSKKHLGVEDFERQMKFLKECCNVISMNEVIELKATNQKWPKNSVAVTFDDGFKNNYSIAAPILQKYSVPATFYICSGMINTDLMFWVDIIEDCINRTLEKELQINLASIKKFDLSSYENKINAVNSVKSFCKLASAQTKNRILEDLIYLSKVTPNINASENYRMMSWKNVRELAANNLFLIGGHTLYHEIMTAQKIETMKLDIKTTISLIDFNLNQNTRHYSYPEGQQKHFNKKVINELKCNGIICSPSAVDGENYHDEDLFNLKRVMPGFMGRKFPL